ncbi:MAG: amidohydrolase [Halobacteriales archaeon]
MDQEALTSLVELRRELHLHPEPAWCEYWTTSRLVDEIEAIPGVSVAYGPDVLDAAERMGVPDASELDRWHELARDLGARADVLEATAGGHTGVVATLARGTGPSVGLRVDIDGLRIEESGADDHRPAASGFRSTTGETMHACGHDAHAAIGVGVLRAVANSSFEGTLTVLFQPAEEVVGGGRAMARGGHLDDVEYLLAIHVGLGHPTGEVVAGVDEFLAVNQFRATFRGASAHAGGQPETGRNAVQAMATAVQNLYAIPRHSAGGTRVNAGRVRGGTAANIIPEHASIEGEVRGASTALMAYMRERAHDTLRAAGEMHDCEVTVETVAEAPGAESDPTLRRVVLDVARDHPAVDSPVERAPLGGSEDATYLMQSVQAAGGLATYVGIGTDHPGGHHTPTFDVDEDSIAIGVEVLTDTVERLAEAHPLEAIEPER